MTAAEKKKVADMQNRERRIRRANEPAPSPPLSIKIRQQLRNRASLGSTGEAFSTQTAEEKASATPVARKDTVPDGATASGKTKQKKPTTGMHFILRLLTMIANI